MPLFAPAHPHAQGAARILSDGVRHLGGPQVNQAYLSALWLGCRRKARIVSPAGALNQIARRDQPKRAWFHS